MLDIGFQELLVVMVIALLVFGPYKLPELGRALGRAMREFRRASDEFRSTIETNLNLNEDMILPPSASDSGTDTDRPASPADSAAPPAGDEAGPGDRAPLESPVHELGDEGEGVAERAGSAGLGAIEPFCAQRGGRLVHRTDCGWAARIADGERVVFKTVGEAAELGLGSCPACEPRDSEPAG